jgi:cyclase
VEAGAGEILLTSMNHDGTKKGFALDITRKLSVNLPVPVIASGGGGVPNHFADVF